MSHCRVILLQSTQGPGATQDRQKRANEREANLRGTREPLYPIREMCYHWSESATDSICIHHCHGKGILLYEKKKYRNRQMKLTLAILQRCRILRCFKHPIFVPPPGILHFWTEVRRDRFGRIHSYNSIPRIREYNFPSKSILIPEFIIRHTSSIAHGATFRQARQICID